jgi:hypothetical protein
MPLQSHTVNHIDQSLGMTQAQAQADFLAVKARIEAQVPTEVVKYHAYPYGSCNTAIKAGLAAGGAVFGRTVNIGIDGQYPGPNLGRSAIATTLHDPYCLPTSGYDYSEIMQPNFNRALGYDPECCPDYGFEAGGKGWNLGAGFAADTADRVHRRRRLSNRITRSPRLDLRIGRGVSWLEWMFGWTTTPNPTASQLHRRRWEAVFRGAAYRNRTDDLFITREFHTRKALHWPASAVSTKATQLGQPDRIEVMYAQNTPTPTQVRLRR